MTENFKPRLIVVAGPNGAGKTTVTEKLLRHEWMEGCEYINPDLIAQNEYGDWNSPEAIINAANKAKAIREQCLESMQSVAFETVFSAPDKLEYIKRAKDAGFFVRIFFICTNDPTINAKRVAQRVMDGGHTVPIDKIISRYYRSIANIVSAIPLADRIYFYDNSETDAVPKLLFRINNGIVEKKYSTLPEWAQEIYNITA
jgi:predicted ABC-type ATPase